MHLCSWQSQIKLISLAMMIFNTFGVVALSLATFSFSVASVLPRNSSKTSPKGAITQLHPVKGSGVLKVPVTKKNPPGLGKRLEGLEKRQDFEDLLNDYTGYLIATEIGTPAQTVQVAIDTGSYELWVSTKIPPFRIFNVSGFWDIEIEMKGSWLMSKTG